MSTRTIIALIILLGAFIAINYDKKQVVAPVPNTVACTMDAMQCPDGSYVGRTGPDCQFVCPNKTITPVTNTGTVKGAIGLSPACGVIMDPPDPNCAFKGYQTTIFFTTSSGKIYKTNSGADGKYSIKLPIGSYKIEAKGGEVLPRCPEPENITVNTNQTITKNIDCESGIR
jgi:hypothetical protein